MGARRVGVRATGALVATLAAGCDDAPTRILVRVDSDLTPGVELRAVDVDARWEGGALLGDRRFDLAAESLRLPGQVVLVPRDAGDRRRLIVTVNGSVVPAAGDPYTLRQEFVAQFDRGRTLVLYYSLARACAIDPCPATFNCVPGRDGTPACVSREHPLVQDYGGPAVDAAVWSSAFPAADASSDGPLVDAFNAFDAFDAAAADDVAASPDTDDGADGRSEGAMDAAADAGPEDVPDADVAVDRPGEDVRETGAPADVACEAGTGCGGACVDTATDEDHCGRCGLACAADEVCTAGACAICPAGRTRCGGDCVDLRADNAHCGRCDRDCDALFPGAFGACLAGTCNASSCRPGYDNCDGVPENGCERNVQADANNCGACHVQCAFAHAGASCVASTCRLGACAAGYFDCDGAPANGCEVMPINDARNCGGCGVACPASTRCVGTECRSQPSCLGPLEAGCGMVPVAGATFTMGQTGAIDVGRAITVVLPGIRVDDFSLDAYEVTVARFRRYWDAGHPGVSAPIVYPGGTLGPFAGPVVEPIARADNPICNWSGAASDRELYPINCIPWQTAQAFCVWDLGRLPTEAEWELAARTPAGFTYPWGEEVPGPTDRLCWSRAENDPCRVGSFAATRGFFDLAGSVTEWSADNYDHYGEGCWSAGYAHDNPLCANSSGKRSARNSYWAAMDGGERAASRTWDLQAGVGDRSYGLRCAMSR